MLKINNVFKPYLMPGMRFFFIISLGQLISLIGSSLTKFALGVWVYQQTESATQFAAITLFAQLPSILFSPLTGALVDRWNRRTAMLISDCGAGISTLAIALLLFSGNIQIWHLYPIIAIGSIFNAFQLPAYQATLALLVPKQHLVRVNSIVTLGLASSQLIAPFLGGILLITLGIKGVFLIDFLTFSVALTTLSIVKIPSHKNTIKKVARKSLISESIYGWNYITSRPGLLGLLLFYTSKNFCLGFVSVLTTPLALSFTTADVLGKILSIGGIGMVVGSVAMNIWGERTRLIPTIVTFNLLGGIAIIIAGFSTEVPLLAFAAFSFFFTTPIVTSSFQTIWQKKVAPEVQGRVFAIRRAISLGSLPLAYIIAGPLADRIFEPLMVANGSLADSVGLYIGVGPGRGIGLLFIIMGILAMLTSFIAYRYKPFRLVETQLPDISS